MANVLTAYMHRNFSYYANPMHRGTFRAFVKVERATGVREWDEVNHVYKGHELIADNVPCQIRHIKMQNDIIEGYDRTAKRMHNLSMPFSWNGVVEGEDGEPVKVRLKLPRLEHGDVITVNKVIFGHVDNENDVSKFIYVVRDIDQSSNAGEVTVRCEHEEKGVV